VHRPEGVTIIAMWSFLCASVCVLGLGGLSIGLLGLWLGGNPKDMVLGTMGLLLGALAVSATAIAFTLTGWGLWKLKSWARGAAIVLAVLQICLIPIGTIAGIATLVYLRRNPEAKKAFGLSVTLPH